MPIFAPKMKRTPSTGIRNEKLWRTCCDVDQKIGVFFGYHLKLLQKTDWILVKTFSFWKSSYFGRQTRLNLINRGGVLEDILGLEDVLEDTFSSPWPRSLKSSKIALSSAQGQHYFFNGKNFADRLKNVFLDRFFWRLTEKEFLRPSFLGKLLHLCPWILASSTPVLGLGLGFFLCPWSCVLDSTSADQSSIKIWVKIFWCFFQSPKQTPSQCKFLATRLPSINLAKQRSINDICDLCWRVFCLSDSYYKLKSIGLRVTDVFFAYIWFVL